MNNIFRAFSVICSVSIMATLGGCGGKKVESNTYRIAIAQYSDHLGLVAAKEGFIERLNELGYIEGKNVTYDYRF